jgi:hypothetical protein
MTAPKRQEALGGTFSVEIPCLVCLKSVTMWPRFDRYSPICFAGSDLPQCRKGRSAKLTSGVLQIATKM